jgi:hypothetical protein
VNWAALFASEAPTDGTIRGVDFPRDGAGMALTDVLAGYTGRRDAVRVDVMPFGFKCIPDDDPGWTRARAFTGSLREGAEPWLIIEHALALDGSWYHLDLVRYDRLAAQYDACTTDADCDYDMARGKVERSCFELAGRAGDWGLPLTCYLL